MREKGRERERERGGISVYARAQIREKRGEVEKTGRGAGNRVEPVTDVP